MKTMRRDGTVQPQMGHWPGPAHRHPGKTDRAAVFLRA